MPTRRFVAVCFLTPSILQVEKVLDAKWFKMERERWPDGFDPTTFVDSQEEDDNEDEDDEVRGAHAEGSGGGGVLLVRREYASS